MLSNDNKNRSKIKWPKAIHSDKEQDIFANEKLEMSPRYENILLGFLPNIL
jgi:hypothetical protein